MLVALSLALLQVPPVGPDFLVKAATEYCEPYARGDASLTDTVARLQADGFQVDANAAADTMLLDFEQQAELSRENGDFVRLYSNGEYHTCRFSDHDQNRDASALNTAIQGDGRWLRIPPLMGDQRSTWVSTDGSMNLSAGLPEERLQMADGDAETRLTVLVTSALYPADVELARRDIALRADQRSPAEAVIQGLDSICPVADFYGHTRTLSGPLSRQLSHEESVHLYEAEFARAGAPPFLRQQDPGTRVVLVSPLPCTLAVRGAGLAQADADIRLWLEQSASPSPQSDVWNRNGQRITLETENLTLYVTVEQTD